MNSNSNTRLAPVSLNYLRSGGTCGWGCYVRCVLPRVSSQRHVSWNHTGLFKLANTTTMGKCSKSGFPARRASQTSSSWHCPLLSPVKSALHGYFLFDFQVLPLLWFFNLQHPDSNFLQLHFPVYHHIDFFLSLTHVSSGCPRAGTRLTCSLL